jgi:lipoate-protein ligase A
MKWRVLPFEFKTGFLNMAIDEAVSESILKTKQPTIRFYGWLPSAVSIGYFQSMDDVVDVWKCKDLGIHIVRRRTGGGAVYHSNSGELTYSVIGPVDMFPKNIIESYKLICGWVIEGLKNLNIKAEFVPINDIVTNGKKISGNAQTRRNKILLQHGTIIYDVDPKRMFTVLKVPDEKIKDKMIKAVEDRVTSIKQLKNVDRDEAYDKIIKGFLKGKQYEFGKLTKKELKRAQELVKTRYSKKEWTFKK